MRGLLAGLAALALLCVACGKYGPPVRPGTKPPAPAAHGAAGCEDPAHDHELEEKSP